MPGEIILYRTDLSPKYEPPIYRKTGRVAPGAARQPRLCRRMQDVLALTSRVNIYKNLLAATDDRASSALSLFPT